MHINWPFPSCVTEMGLKATPGIWKRAGNRYHHFLAPKVTTAREVKLDWQEAWLAAKGLAGWGGPLAGSTAGNSWDTALRRLQLKLTVLQMSPIPPPPFSWSTQPLSHPRTLPMTTLLPMTMNYEYMHIFPLVNLFPSPSPSALWDLSVCCRHPHSKQNRPGKRRRETG